MADNKIDIFLIIIALLMLLLFLFPLEKQFSKIFKREIKKTQVYIYLTLLALATVFMSSGWLFLPNLIMITLSIFVFLFGMLSDRKHIYTLALISFCLMPITILMNLDGIADFFSQICYLLLVMGVINDLFREKIYE